MPVSMFALWHSDFGYATHNPSGLTIGDAPMPPPTITCRVRTVGVRLHQRG